MLKILRNIIQEVNNAKDFREAVHIIVKRTQEFTHANASSIFLVDENSSEYVLSAAEGLDKNIVEKLRIKFGDGLIGLVGERAEPINIANTLDHPKFCHYDQLSKNLFHAFLGVPITHQGQLLGILVAQKQEPNSFTEDEETFLITLSAQLAGVIALSKATGTFSIYTQKQKSLVLNGMSCVSGVSIGKIVVIYPLADLESVIDKPAGNIEQEIIHFKQALKTVQNEISQLHKKINNKAERALFEAYLQILNSHGLKKDVLKKIQEGLWAPSALKAAINKRVSQFQTMEDTYLRERALDIKDLGQRILAHLQTKQPTIKSYPKNTILVGEEITPAALADVPTKKLVGIISAKGSITSHTAILARALNVPTVLGITKFSAAQQEGKKAIIDGYCGQVYINPSKKIYAQFADLLKQEHEMQYEMKKLSNLPAETTDGYSIKLLVNTGLPGDIGHSLQIGADGVGLYRTEIPFMVRNGFPSEEEQKIIYQQLLKVFSPRPVTMRTLDIGGDKYLPYFPIQETNPYLGWRGIRVTLDHPEIFLVQIRAMLRADLEFNNLQILLPMISNINEAEEAIKLIKQAQKELSENYPNIKLPKIGIMIEVPSAVYQAQDLARLSDFLSVGSNDLTQYLLAVDRNNAQVANLYDSLHPAVIKALIQIVTAAHKENKTVSICGEMAGDPTSIPLLLAIGFDALSMNANQLLKIKWLIRNFSMEKAKILLAKILQMDDQLEIRSYLESALEEEGLAGLIRAGK